MGVRDRLLARFKVAAVGTGLRTSWREWQFPAALLLGSWTVGLAALPLHGVPHWLGHSLSSLLWTASWATACLTVSRFAFACARREAQIRSLVALGGDAPFGPLLSVLDAELSSRPPVLRFHLSGLLEPARARVARKTAESPADTLPSLCGAVRKWLFGPAPAGPFPSYAADLLAVVDTDPGPECLPLLRDLRDPAAHIARDAAEEDLRARSGELIARNLGPARVEVVTTETRAFENLIARISRGSQVGRALAEQELRAMGPDAVRAIAEARPGRKWWWGLPGLIVLGGGLAVWYLWAHHIPVDPDSHLNLGLHGRAFYDKMSPLVRGLVAVGAASILASWTFGFPVAWSRFRTRRSIERLTAALSLIEGREAVGALLAFLRSTERMLPEDRRPKPLARAARRLVGLPPEIAAELLGPHGDWFFRRPLGQFKNDEWAKEEEKARALLAVIQHTWDLAGRPLLRFWSRNASCPFRAEAQAALDELEARLARQGTLLRPAPVSPNYLLRPAGVGETDEGTLLRASDAPAAVEAASQPSTDVDATAAALQAISRQA